MQEPRLTEVTLLYARGKNLSTGELFLTVRRWEVNCRGATFYEANRPSFHPGSTPPVPGARGLRVCNQTVYLIYLYS